MELLANRSFSGDEVKQMLTGLYEVLAKAEKYAKEKEQEAEAANVRSRALEKVILYGDFDDFSSYKMNLFCEVDWIFMDLH